MNGIIIGYTVLWVVASMLLRNFYLESKRENMKVDSSIYLAQSVITALDEKNDELSSLNKTIIDNPRLLNENKEKMHFFALYNKDFKKQISYIDLKYENKMKVLESEFIKIVSNSKSKKQGLVKIEGTPALVSVDKSFRNGKELTAFSVYILDPNNLSNLEKEMDFDMKALNNEYTDLKPISILESKYFNSIYKQASIGESKILSGIIFSDIYGNATIEAKYNFHKYITQKLDVLDTKFSLFCDLINVVFTIIGLIILNIYVFDKINKFNEVFKGVLLKNKLILETENENAKIDILDSDISNLSKYIEDFKSKADFYFERDTITGLYNRQAFLNNKLFEKKVDFYKALIFINIDGFSVINKTLGYENGNTILNEVGKLITKSLPKDSFLARVGGDEFAALFECSNNKQVEEVVNGIIDNINNNIEINGKPHFVSCSIGVAYCNSDLESPAKNLNNAYETMLSARSKGMNSYAFFKGAEIELKNNITLDMLQNSLKNDEIKVYYQPKVNAKTTKIEGMEALARWFHPELGYIPPYVFIELAEKTGYILTLGNWILEKVCKDIIELNKDTNRNLKVSVNVSAIQLIRNDYIDSVKKIIEKTKVDSNVLEIEVTETVAMGNFEEINSRFKALKEFGITIDIDDFGTGYSTLSYLQKYDVDVMKLDKSFVDSIDINEEFIKSIIDMIHSVGALVVAEGVETFPQYLKLQQFNCDLIQGYYFYKPVPIKELKQIILEENKKYMEV